jgi:hypothetical protein
MSGGKKAQENKAKITDYFKPGFLIVGGAVWWKSAPSSRLQWHCKRSESR